MENKQNLIPIRVSVSEAARLFGVSTKTIREALRANEVRYIISRGRYKINFESLLKWSQLSTRRRNQLTSQGIGQFVKNWQIHNKKYSPSEELAKRIKKPEKHEDDANKR